MFGHLPEFAIVLVVALIVFGPEKLPEVAAQAGKMVREVRQAMDQVMNPAEPDVPDDFSTYYYESMARGGEPVPPAPEEAEAGAGVWPGVAGTEEVDLAMPPIDTAAEPGELGWGEAYDRYHESDEVPTETAEPRPESSAVPYLHGTGSAADHDAGGHTEK